MDENITPNQTYQRSQLEIALWEFFCRSANGSLDKSPLFQARVKKLLDTDRVMPVIKFPGASKYAFRSENEFGKGSDIRFTLEDTYCLWCALELTDIGLKQAEVVFLIRHIRNGLEKLFKSIIKDPYLGRGTASSKDYPNFPEYKDKKGWNTADRFVYMVINKVEFKELYPIMKKSRNPLIFIPEIVRGTVAFMHYLADVSYFQRKFISIEMSEAAHCLPSLLREAPPLKRGRK